MVFFNWATMQMAAKIVYYGPGLCGKTTNLSFIYAKTSPGSRGEMVSLETETDRTLFFDLLPLEVGKVGGFRTRLQLYTVPGQVFYNTTRKLVLKGVDGVVFVADSQRPMAEANVESFKNLDENLRELGLEAAGVPLVLQYNKRDLKNVMSVEELTELLDPERRWEHYEAVAVQGLGVFETLKAVTKGTLKALRRRMANQESASAPAPAPAAASRPISFNAAALSAAAAEGVGTPLAAPLAAPVAVSAGGAAMASLAQPVAAAVMDPPPMLEEVPEPPISAPADAAHFAPEGDTAPVIEPVAVEELTSEEEVPEAIETLPPVEPLVELVEPIVEDVCEAEEAPVEFATNVETPPRAAVAAEVRHVKVSSSLDILAELETLRKAATSRPSHNTQSPAEPAPAYDLDSLLQSSLNSRLEVRRRVEQNVGPALRKAASCLVRIELVDGDGGIVTAVSPVEVEIKQGERVKQLAMTLTVHLQGE